jgi:hypothetical protein
MRRETDRTADSLGETTGDALVDAGLRQFLRCTTSATLANGVTVLRGRVSPKDEHDALET